MARRLLIKTAMLLALAAGGTGPLQGAPRAWETVRTERSDVKTVVKEPEVEIKVARGLLVVTCSRQTTIKVVTILGRTVSTETLPAGTSQLTLAHGVYIVKTGELTVKIAV